jgi:hypothetical protein
MCLLCRRQSNKIGPPVQRVRDRLCHLFSGFEGLRETSAPARYNLYRYLLLGTIQVVLTELALVAVISMHHDCGVVSYHLEGLHFQII